jgi:chemotaxis protein MotA
MDPATIIGIIVAFGAMYTMISLEGADVTSILLPAPMILVFGATLAVGFASGTIPDAILALKALPRAFKGGIGKPQAVIDRVVEFAEIARRDGLLALEQHASDEKDDFLRLALQNIADGMDAEELRELLEDEIATRDRVNRTAAKFFNTIGGYAPTIGIIGTVISLTHVLENLSSPDKLGHSIAGAFVATLWGVLSANLIWLPIGTRLTRLADLDSERMHLLLEGMLAVQAGSQPRVLGERLLAMVPAHARGSAGKGEKPLKEAA